MYASIETHIYREKRIRLQSNPKIIRYTRKPKYTETLQQYVLVILLCNYNNNILFTGAGDSNFIQGLNQQTPHSSSTVSGKVLKQYHI